MRRDVVLCDQNLRPDHHLLEVTILHVPRIESVNAVSDFGWRHTILHLDLPRAAIPSIRRTAPPFFIPDGGAAIAGIPDDGPGVGLDAMGGIPPPTAGGAIAGGAIVGGAIDGGAIVLGAILGNGILPAIGAEIGACPCPNRLGILPLPRIITTASYTIFPLVFPRTAPPSQKPFCFLSAATNSLATDTGGGSFMPVGFHPCAIPAIRRFCSGDLLGITMVQIG